MRAPVILCGEARTNSKSRGIDDHVRVLKQRVCLGDVHFTIECRAVNDLLRVKRCSQMAAYEAVGSHNNNEGFSGHTLYANGNCLVGPEYLSKLSTLLSSLPAGRRSRSGVLADTLEAEPEAPHRDGKSCFQEAAALHRNSFLPAQWLHRR